MDSPLVTSHFGRLPPNYGHVKTHHSRCPAQDPSAQFDQFLSSIGFQGAALVSRGGSVLFQKGYGPANAEYDIPNDTATKFRLLSLTKQFTALAIMQLEERGLLRVTDPACRYLDPCPDAWRDITIHHLFIHGSGIPDGFDIPAFASPLHCPPPRPRPFSVGCSTSP